MWLVTRASQNGNFLNLYCFFDSCIFFTLLLSFTIVPLINVNGKRELKNLTTGRFINDLIIILLPTKKQHLYNIHTILNNVFNNSGRNEKLKIEYHSLILNNSKFKCFLFIFVVRKLLKFIELYVFFSFLFPFGFLIQLIGSIIQNLSAFYF